MLLKSIDLQGYKTFAGRTTFEFAGAITCIVGPNGSGKSNIADAIRWVLGEQSYRLLRGKKTEDMIFSGSESRSRAGMASANIIFDNTSGWLPVDFSEVSIARRAYRDGTNEYLLNGQRVRLRDITELLASSGLSERTYTIIGQGLVDAALALRAEDRRRLFEEAAGIGLYRSRREEALRRLETTYRNIERVEDILAELRPRLRSLERQSRRAEQFSQVEKDLKELLRDYYGYHWYRAQRELNQARETARIQESMFEAVRQEQSGLNHQLSSYREQIQGLRARLASWHRDLSQLHRQRETVTREQAVLDERERLLGVQKIETSTQLVRLSDQIQLQEERVANAKVAAEKLEDEFSDARVQLQSSRQTLDGKKQELTQTTDKVRKLRKELGDQQTNQNRLQARLVERRLNLERQEEALQKSIDAIKGLEQQYEKGVDALESAQAGYDGANQYRQKAENILEQQRETIKKVNDDRMKAADQRSKHNTKLAGLEAQMKVLEQAEKALAGYANGTQLLLKSVQQGKLKGTQGAFSTQLDVPEEIEPAIAAALGEYLDAVLLEDIQASDDALDLLIQHTTRGTVLPVTSLIPLKPLSPLKVSGVFGVASDLVQAPALLRPAVDLLLGQTLVVRDRTAARLALREQSSTTRAVTLKGEVFYASGQISVGASGEASTISRPRQRRELDQRSRDVRKKIDLLSDDIDQFDGKLGILMEEEASSLNDLQGKKAREKAASDHLNQCSLNVDRIDNQRQWQYEQRDQISADILKLKAEIQKISGTLVEVEDEIVKTQGLIKEEQAKVSTLSLDDFISQVNYWQTQVAVMKQGVDSAKARQTEQKRTLEEIIRSRDNITDRMLVIDTNQEEIGTKKVQLRSQEAEIIEKIGALRNLIDPAEAEMSKLEELQDEIQDTEAKARQGLTTADHRFSQAQLAMTRQQEMLDSLRERIEDDLRLVSFEYDADISGPKPLPFGEMVEQLPAVFQLPDEMEKTIKRQRAQLRRMGLVNPEAQTEYKEVKERFEFMNTQIEDLRKAENDIKDVIGELDGLMKRAFNLTFEQVAKEFRDIFTRLFGGGSARLVLTDPDDLTQTGIEIEARLPGRRTQGLSLLSGGERSLTAAALVFSLLKVSPTPFCVLDEVDAMLDEANVGRFRDLLRELAENTQFIVITHNRNTVQAADVIYGVTMGRDSASQMISLKLDEVADVV